MISGKAVIFCAPSGAGKTTIVKRVVSAMPTLKFSISATTRPPRQSVEKDGRDYHFLTRNEFSRKATSGDFLEWEEVYQDIFYGTLRSEVDRIWENGNHAIFDVDVKGGLNLKQALGKNALAIFVNAESIAVLRERLLARNTESIEKIETRISKAHEEMAFVTMFDYELVNRDLDIAVEEALGLIRKFLL